MERADDIRRYQRQEFLSSLQRKVYDAEEEKEMRWGRLALDLAICIFLILKSKTQWLLSENTPVDKFARVFFETEILPAVSKFARSRRERDFLLAEFLSRHLLHEAMRQAVNDLHDEERENPQKIFHAPSSATEVSFPIEE